MLQDEFVTDLEKNISIALRTKAESYVASISHILKVLQALNRKV